MRFSRVIPISDDEISLDEIWDYYQQTRRGLLEYKDNLRHQRISSTPITNPKFEFYTLADLEDYFVKCLTELDRLFCFDIIAATEGILFRDFFRRVYEKDKSDVGRDFRSAFNILEVKDRPSLEQDVIENWKNRINYTQVKHFSAFLTVLNYRHWIAHGRFWKLTYRAQKHSAYDALKIGEEIIKIVENYK